MWMPPPSRTFAKAWPWRPKYTDLPNRNGEYNGKIDANDRKPIGYPTVPEIVYGFGVNAGYKGWTLVSSSKKQHQYVLGASTPSALSTTATCLSL